MSSEGFRWKRSHKQLDQVPLVLWKVTLKTINIVKAFEGYWTVCSIILLLFSSGTLHVVLIDTCADETHHAHNSGEKNCNRCLNGTQLQIITVCAVSLIQAGSRVWSAPFLGRFEFSWTTELSGSGQNFLKEKKLLIVGATGFLGEGLSWTSSHCQYFLQYQRTILSAILESCLQTIFGERDCFCSQPIQQCFLQSNCTGFWVLLLSSAIFWLL